MKLAVIGFTRSGCGYAKKIEEAMKAKGRDCTAWGKGANASLWEVHLVEGALRDWTKEQFGTQDALIFVGATGIAVRSIAPFVKSKASDPAVLCMDEQGKYVISLLSGHLGGANELAEEIADICGAIPIITTATDLNGRFSVDSFAKREGLYLDSLEIAKRISAQLLEHQVIGLHSDFPMEGSIPEGLSMQEKGELGISISLNDKYNPFKETLHLIPKIVVLGIGCKKGVFREQIESLVKTVMDENQLSMYSISKVASIDLKEKEEGLLAFCQEYHLPFLTYLREELETVSCEGGFSESSFVKNVTGVGNVCERSALKASGQMRLLRRKTAENGVTVAIALEKYCVHWRQK